MRKLDVRTVTVQRGDTDITVEFSLVTRGGGRSWEVTAALDEDGRPVPLTSAEWAEAGRLILLGCDETGR